MSLTITEAHKRYLDYHLRGNTMGTTPEIMGQIIYQYSDWLSTWQANATDDVNKYEFDDAEFEQYVYDGKEEAKELTGYENSTIDKIGQVANTGSDVVTSVGGAVASAGGEIIAKSVGKKAGAKAAQEVIKKAGDEAVRQATEIALKEGMDEAATKAFEETAIKTAEKLAEEAAEEAAQKAAAEAAKKASSISFMIACTLGAATAAKYWATRPNKEQVEAALTMQQELGKSQGELVSTQNEMVEMESNLEAATNTAEAYNNQANEYMMEQKMYYEWNKEYFEGLKAKAESGVPLTEQEKSDYANYIAAMQEAGDNIENAQNEATSVVTSIHSDMETYQEGFDAAAETMGNIQGKTEYTAGFDKMTRVMCYVEAGAQALNAASSATGAVKAGRAATLGTFAFGAGAWAWAFVALGTAGAVGSSFAVAEQLKFAKQLTDVINIRQATEGLNTETMDNYDAHITNYEGYMNDVESFTLDVPDETGAPEDTSLPDNTQKDPEKDKVAKK